MAVLAAWAMHAMAGDGKGNDPTRRLQQQLRHAEQEKGKLAREKADAEGRVQALQDQLAASGQKVEGAQRRAGQLAKELAAVKADLGERLAQTQRRLDEAERTAALDRHRCEADRASWGEISRQQLAALGNCRQRNQGMYRLGNELLERYEAKSCLDASLQAEPFTGLKRAQIEKWAEEEREKLDREEILPGPLPAGYSPQDKKGLAQGSPG